MFHATTVIQMLITNCANLSQNVVPRSYTDMEALFPMGIANKRVDRKNSFTSCLKKNYHFSNMTITYITLLPHLQNRSSPYFSTSQIHQLFWLLTI